MTTIIVQLVSVLNLVRVSYVRRVLNAKWLQILCVNQVLPYVRLGQFVNLFWLTQIPVKWVLLCPIMLPMK